MNRHGYKVRKFGRQVDQRQALIKGLANELIVNGSIETTLPKAKATVRYTERLITKAKAAQGNLHKRRQVISSLTTLDAAHRLVDDISPLLDTRSSGHLRIKKTVLRRGDGSQLARISFVDNISAKTETKVQTKTKDKPKTDDNKSTQTRVRAEKKMEAHGPSAVQAPKRAGRRGDR